MRISYLLGILLTFSVVFGLTKLNNATELLFDLITLVAVTTTFMWLKKTVVLLGLIFYTITFNFDILLNPILPFGAQQTFEIHAFLFKINLLAFTFVILGLIDGWLGHKYLNFKTQIRENVLVISIIVLILVFQIVFRVWVI